MEIRLKCGKNGDANNVLVYDISTFTQINGKHKIFKSNRLKLD